MAVTSTDLTENCTKFSINNFVSDLPRLLNKAFSTLIDCITQFYNPDKDKITCSNADIEYLTVTSLVANNLSLRDDAGAVYTLQGLADMVNELKEKVNNITAISQSEIDAVTGR